MEEEEDFVSVLHKTDEGLLKEWSEEISKTLSSEDGQKTFKLFLQSLDFTEDVDRLEFLKEVEKVLASDDSVVNEAQAVYKEYVENYKMNLDGGIVKLMGEGMKENNEEKVREGFRRARKEMKTQLRSSYDIFVQQITEHLNR